MLTIINLITSVNYTYNFLFICCIASNMFCNFNCILHIFLPEDGHNE
jgi:hypothetical protein